MTRMIRLALLLLVAGVARADGGAPARILDVRVGDHPGFERLVIELDREAEVVWENGPEPGEESFYVAAAPRQRSKVLVTQLPNLGTVSVTEMKGGTHVAVEPKARRVRAYLLDSPPRLVVDFAPPGKEPFVAPAGSRPLEAATSLGPLVLEPEPARVPERRKPELKPEPKPEPRPEPAPAPRLEAPPDLDLVVVPAPEPVPAPVVVPAPEVRPKPRPEPAPARPMPAPIPAPAVPSTDVPFPYWVGLLAALGALAILALLLLRRRSLRGEDEPVTIARAEPPPTGVHEIAPEEIYGSGERERALEQRLDQEERARVALEQRFAEANEELKVLRDRLQRVERRREPTG